MEDLSLVRVNEPELETLLELSIKTFRDAFFYRNTPESYYGYVNRAFTSEQLRSELLNPDSHFYFLKKGSNILAYIKLNYSGAQSDIRDPDALEIERIYVLQEFQNLKLGGFLIDQIKQLAIQQGLQYIWLGVWDQNLSAIRFYENHGFLKFGAHNFMLGDELQIDLLMKWKTPASVEVVESK